MQDNSGAAALAQVFAERITSQTAKPDALELGTIQGDMSLLVDRFLVPIPKGEYLIAEWLLKVNLPAFTLVGNETSPVDEQGTPLPGATTIMTRYDIEPGEIDEVHTEPKPNIKPGDRVLVAWVNDHSDPVVLCRVVSS